MKAAIESVSTVQHREQLSSQISVEENCHERMIDQRCGYPRIWPVLSSPSLPELRAAATTGPIRGQR